MFFESLQRHAIRHPSKVAIVEINRTISYGELNLLISRVAYNLSAIGVTERTKITVCLDNSIEYIALYFAVAKLGAMIIPLTTTLSDEEVLAFCSQSKSDYIICEHHYVDKFTFEKSSGIQSTLISESTPSVNLKDIFENKGALYEGNTIDPDQDFVIQYTSGTTGLPKGIVQTQRSHVRRMELWASTANLKDNDRTLCMLSLAHAYGADIITWPALLTGQTLYLLPVGDCTPAQIAHLIDEESITVFGSLPWFYKELIETPNIDWYSLSSLRIAMCGATPLSRTIAQKFIQTFNLKINNSYGLTETCLITSNLFKTGKEDMMSVGQVIDGVSHQIRDCGLDLPNAGELLVKSEGFAIRYLEQSEVELWNEGWIATGDLVRKDENECFYILGRLSEIIETPKGSILPFEIEEVVMDLPGVKEVAVVPLQGQGGIFIVAEPGITAQDILQYISTLSPRFQYVKDIKFMDSFPKSVTGKISKAKLEL